METIPGGVAAATRSLVLDTTILIYYLRGLPGARALLEWTGRPGVPLVSTVTHLEIYQGMQPREEDATEALLDGMLVQPLTREVARKAGEILRYLRAREQAIELPDAVIAATALLNGRALLTLNASHFRRVPGLEVIDGQDILGLLAT